MCARASTTAKKIFPQARLIVATVRGVRIASAYFRTAARRRSHRKYPYKIAWMKRLARTSIGTSIRASAFLLVRRLQRRPRTSTSRTRALARHGPRERRGARRAEHIRRWASRTSSGSTTPRVDLLVVGYPPHARLPEERRAAHRSTLRTPPIAARSEARALVDREEPRQGGERSRARVCVFSE